MKTRTVVRRISAGILALGLGAMLVAAVGQASSHVAHASGGGNTITISNGKLVNRVAVRLTVTVACALPLDAIDSGMSTSSITITQASGHTITSGYSNFGFSIVCNGLPVTYTAEVMPSAGLPTFHGGPALARAYFEVPYYNPATGEYGSVYGSAEQTIRISG